MASKGTQRELKETKTDAKRPRKEYIFHYHLFEIRSELSRTNDAIRKI